MAQVEVPLHLSGDYLQPYNAIVRPEQVWKISKYFLRRWTPYLSASEVWLVIGARQLSYFNEGKPWFKAYDQTLAEAAGLHVKVFRRTIKEAIATGEGRIATFIRKQGDPAYRFTGTIPKQTQTPYSIRLDDPLTPGDADALAYWLRRHAPRQVTPESVAGLLATGRETAPALLRAPDCNPVTGEVAGMETVMDVVQHVFPVVAAANSWREAADALHTYLVQPELAHFETHYFRRQWVPALGPGPALLFTYLRSLCFYNEESKEIRDQVTLRSGELEAVFQVSSRTLRRWFKQLTAAVPMEALFGPLYTVVDSWKEPSQQVTTRYWLNLQTPICAADWAEYERLVQANGALEGPETGVTDKKFPTADGGGGQIVPHAMGGQGQKVPHGAGGGGQIVPHEQGGDGQKVPGWGTKSGAYKYYKILLETLEIPEEGLEDFFQTSAPEQWHILDEQAGRSFAVVVTGNELENFLEQLGIQEPARGDIVRTRPDPANVVAWTLYSTQTDGLSNPVAYLIKRLQAGDEPPQPFQEVAGMTWATWRTFAVLKELPEPAVAATLQSQADWSSWKPLYGTVSPAGLPFGVGEGIPQLKRYLRRQRSAAEPITAPTSDQELWQATLRELEQQMVRATFNAWLRDAELINRDGDTFIIGVRNEQAKDWILHRLRPVIERTLSLLADRPAVIEIQILTKLNP